MLRQLIDIQYERNDMDFQAGHLPGAGRRGGDHPGQRGGDGGPGGVFRGRDRPDRHRSTCSPGRSRASWSTWPSFPASHYVVPAEQIRRAADAIEEELEERVRYFKGEGQASWRRSGSRSGRTLTWRCSRRRASAPGSRTIPGIWRGWRRGSRPYTLLDLFSG